MTLAGWKLLRYVCAKSPADAWRNPSFEGPLSGQPDGCRGVSPPFADDGVLTLPRPHAFRNEHYAGPAYSFPRKICVGRFLTQWHHTSLA
ncbi:hypothetical protein PGTUg99_014473 [Puccinia graminis f. sp. tritici]|uniref:Uncharacterized protein n=1 Tax=Puccinia graminis f. sp. tritici TaxID=56615 RepID=A0A5B0LWX8_PUCGR|nr:hypothetical protein PGTUg99_014473 [Puccinia graminis f. sp. tritici]